MQTYLNQTENQMIVDNFEVFKKIIMDDTIPGGPIEREIEFVAPFDCCNRESDYEKVWDYFINKYEDVGGEQQNAFAILENKNRSL